MLSNSEYQNLVKKESPNSPKIKNMIFAYLIGGLICTLGQLFFELYLSVGLDENTAKALVPMTLILITAILTGLDVFHKIAKHAGAGTLVPITGFANAVVSPAIEFKTEGYVLGTTVNMFKIAGPVIVFGTTASIIYGIIYYVLEVL